MATVARIYLSSYDNKIFEIKMTLYFGRIYSNKINLFSHAMHYPAYVYACAEISVNYPWISVGTRKYFV